MRSLLGNRAMDEKILRQLWSNKLPPHVQSILTKASDKLLVDHSFLADQVMDAYQVTDDGSRPSPTVEQDPHPETTIHKGFVGFPRHIRRYAKQPCLFQQIPSSDGCLWLESSESLVPCQSHQRRPSKSKYFQ